MRRGGGGGGGTVEGWREESRYNKNNRLCMQMCIRPGLCCLYTVKYNEKQVIRLKMHPGLRIDIFSGETTLSQFMFLKNGCTYSIRKEFFRRVKFLPLRVDPFTEGNWFTGKKIGSHKSCLSCTKWKKIYQVHPVPLIMHICT